MNKQTWLAGVALSLLAVPWPALGQGQQRDGAVEARVGRLESEMRAVQRRVFPGGAGQNVQPDISTATRDASVPGTPSSNPLIDLTARVAALETQVRGLTGQVEQNSHRIQLLEDQFTALRRATSAIPASPPPGAAIDDEDAPPRSPPRSPPPRPSAGGTTPRPSGVSRPLGDPNAGATRPSTPAPAANDPARQRLVAAVARPTDSDPAEASYLYGYRLWAAHFYPEAEAQLQQTVQRYPNHRRASYAQNLLGRAYLDDNKPSLASFALYDSYRRFPEGERAHESLYYLATALIRLDKPTDACRVFGELTEVYPTRIDATMRTNINSGRAQAHCR